MEISQFGRLSPELRNRIYELSFASPCGTFENRFAIERNSFKQCVALTQTCRQIRNETRAMFYANACIFATVGGETQSAKLCVFLEVLVPDIIRCVDIIRIFIHGYYVRDSKSVYCVTGENQIARLLGSSYLDTPTPEAFT